MHAFALPRFALAATLLLAIGCEAPDREAAADGRPVGDAAAELAPVNQSGVTGSVRAEHGDDEAEVTVELAGLQPSATYGVHVHTGRCAAGGPVAAPLGDVSAGSDGTARLTAEVAGSQLGPDDPAFIQVEDASGSAVACADLPGHDRGEQPLTDRLGEDTAAGAPEGERE